MLSVGSHAPSFSLAGVQNGGRESYDLTTHTSAGNAVLVLFYPFDFSPACTQELCSVRDAEWFTLVDDLHVWGISTDSTYAHEQFAAAYQFQFPLLSDTDGSVASAFGVLYDEWEEHKHVPKRAVFLVDSDQTIRYAWATDDAYDEPELSAIKRALDELGSFRADFTQSDGVFDS